MPEDNSDLVNEIPINELETKIAAKQTFVINIVADWCPDCTQRQRPHLPAFIVQLEAAGLPFYQIKVQKEKRIFISEKHRVMTENFGGHGYPRTALLIDGEIQEDSKLEKTTAEELEIVAVEFLEKIQQSS